MNARPRLVMAWSGGKDCALALHELQRDGQYDVVGLLTTVAMPFDRVSHHGVRSSLIERQAEAIGIPLHRIDLPVGESDEVVMAEYERLMRDAMLEYRSQGVDTVAFGDIFLEDLRAHRERKLAEIGMHAVFPLWKRDTTELAHAFINAGFRAVLTCVMSEKLDQSFAGRQFDLDLLRDLPEGVDPCGERGEFHSFVYAGPVFHQPLAVDVGETVTRDVRFFAEITEPPPPRSARSCAVR